MQVGYDKAQWYINLTHKDQNIVDALVAAQLFQGDMEPLQEQEFVPASKVYRHVEYERHEVDELLSDKTRLFMKDYHPKDESSYTPPTDEEGVAIEVFGTDGNEKGKDKKDKKEVKYTSTTWLMFKRLGACEDDYKKKLWFRNINRS